MAGPTIPNQGYLSIGLTPLAYMGVRPTSPAQYLIETRDPLTTDRNYILGTWWFNNNSPYNLWRLVNLNAGVALWILVNASPGALLSLTSNSGGPVFPLAGNINVVGDGITITGVGNPATHTITFSLLGSGVVETLTGNSGGAVGPTAGNINVVGSNANNINIVGNPGTSTLTASVSGTTNHALQVGNASGSLTSLAVAGNGQLPIGSAGANPVIANLTAGSGISITNGAGSITIAAAGSVAQSFPTDSGTATPSAGVLNIVAGFSTQNSGATVEFTGSGNTVTLNVTDANNNTFIGKTAANATYTGVNNTGIGLQALISLTSGSRNTACGVGTLDLLTTGNNNAAFGYGALGSNTTGSNNTAIGEGAYDTAGQTGSNNTALGQGAASAYTGAESSNIIIGAGLAGTLGESNVLRIGNGTGAGATQINQTFIAGIRGITTVNNNAIAVLIDSAGQLGTTSSSIRYKENITPMNDYSDHLYDLNPVVFNYINHSSDSKSVGLIAEEVAQIMPQLVIVDSDGCPETVKYQDLVPMLLNELIKLKKRIDELDSLSHKSTAEQEKENQ